MNETNTPEMTSQLSLLPVQHVPAFALAGNALFTIVSKKTGQRFTYKVQKGKKPEVQKLSFVKVLTGSNNEGDYTFLGTIFDASKFVCSKKSPISPEAPSAKAFTWFMSALQANQLTSFDVYHHGRCCRCGRTLTVPESIEAGIGPECVKKGM